MTAIATANDDGAMSDIALRVTPGPAESVTAPAITDGDGELRRRRLCETFGVRYFEAGAREIADAREDNLYSYRAYVGAHAIAVERGDAVCWLDDDLGRALLQRGPCHVHSHHLATVVRGYMPEDKTTTLRHRTTLPYVNGCSTKQLFPPERPGDPTLQLLDIPPYSAEQAHHIHSTVRVVYVLRGRGTSVVGMDQATVSEPLYPGKVIVLEPMCPHHFESSAEHLVCVPFHVFSSVGAEKFHPMLTGTHLIDP